MSRAICQQPQAATERVPAVLGHILMMTAFHWNTEHLSFLSQARPICMQMVMQASLGARGHLCQQLCVASTWLNATSSFEIKLACARARLPCG